MQETSKNQDMIDVMHLIRILVNRKKLLFTGFGVLFLIGMVIGLFSVVDRTKFEIVYNGIYHDSTFNDSYAQFNSGEASRLRTELGFKVTVVQSENPNLGYNKADLVYTFTAKTEGLESYQAAVAASARRAALNDLILINNRIIKYNKDLLKANGNITSGVKRFLEALNSLPVSQRGGELPRMSGSFNNSQFESILPYLATLSYEQKKAYLNNYYALLTLQNSLYQSEISNASRNLRMIDEIGASPDADHSAEYEVLKLSPAESDYAVTVNEYALATPAVHPYMKFTITAVLKRAVVAIAAAAFCAVVLVYFIELLVYLKKRWQDSK